MPSAARPKQQNHHAPQTTTHTRPPQRRDAARQRIREIEAEEERLIEDSDDLDGGRMQVTTRAANTVSANIAAIAATVDAPAAESSGTDTTGTNVGANVPSAAASSSAAAGTGVSPRTKAKKKNGKKKSGGGAAGARNIGTTTINVNNPPTTETAGGPLVEPGCVEASLDEEYDELAPGDKDDPEESIAYLRGAELGKQMALDAKAGLIEGLEGGPQPADRGEAHAELYNSTTTATAGAASPSDVAAMLQGIVPQSTTINIDGQDGDLTNGQSNSTKEFPMNTIKIEPALTTTSPPPPPPASLAHFVRRRCRRSGGESGWGRAWTGPCH